MHEIRFDADQHGHRSHRLSARAIRRRRFHRARRVARGRVATTFELPVVLSTVHVKHGMSGTNAELREALPGVPEIDRTTMNSWEDPEFRAAVERTGRKKLVAAGL